MDALSIIDRGTQTVDTVAPAKAKNKNEQQFGVVLNEKQQINHPHKNKPVDGQNAVSNEVAIQNTLQSDAEMIPQWQAKVQHTLVDLMKAVVQAESTGSEGSSDITVAQSEPAEAEDSKAIETLLTDLVQQLESTEHHGEQVLAGVDLTQLVTELQSLQDAPDHEELLAQLVAQIENQLKGQPELQGNTELSASIILTDQPELEVNTERSTPMLVEATQRNATPIAVENLAQARQILQKAFDAVAPQKTVVTENVAMEENVVVVEQPAEETFFAAGKASEKIDPRFAGLLKQREEQLPGQKIRSGNASSSLHHSKQHVELKQGEPTVQVPAAEMAQKVETTLPSAAGSKQVLENLLQQSQHNLQSQGHPQIQGLNTNKAMPQTPIVQLASGQQVPDSQIFDQVVTHLSGSVNGDTGRMVLRLQPAELGSLRIELMVEGDRIRANLHAQSHQVQEVLERNLPQLRNALAEQGLKIDQFQINVDQRQQSGQFENLAQQNQQHGSEKQPGWQQQNLEPEEQIIPLAHLMQNGGGGISLHV